MENNGEKENNFDSPVSFRKVRTKVERYLGGSDSGLKAYEFGPRQVKWLEVFTKTLDYKLASKESELPYPQVEKSQYMVNEIQLIMESVSYKHRSSAALPNHHRLMAKIEKDYDAAIVARKPAFASVLAKMSDTSLKAEGEFNDDSNNSGDNNLTIRFNFGGRESLKLDDTVNIVVDKKE